MLSIPRQAPGCPTAVVPNLLGTREQFHGRQLFHGPQWGVEDGFGMIPSPLHLLCTLLLILLHYLYLRSSGIRSGRLETPLSPTALPHQCPQGFMLSRPQTDLASSSKTAPHPRSCLRAGSYILPSSFPHTHPSLHPVSIPRHRLLVILTWVSSGDPLQSQRHLCNPHKQMGLLYNTVHENQK